MFFRVSALIAVLVTPVFAASTDLQTFEKTVNKYAPAIDAALKLKKAPCVCQDQSANHGRAGVLVHVANGGGFPPSVACLIPFFDPTTEEQETLGTCATFEYLGK